LQFSGYVIFLTGEKQTVVDLTSLLNAMKTASSPSKNAGSERVGAVPKNTESTFAAILKASVVSKAAAQSGKELPLSGNALPAMGAQKQEGAALQNRVLKSGLSVLVSGEEPSDQALSEFAMHQGIDPIALKSLLEKSETPPSSSSNTKAALVGGDLPAKEGANATVLGLSDSTDRVASKHILNVTKQLSDALTDQQPKVNSSVSHSSIGHYQDQSSTLRVETELSDQQADIFGAIGMSKEVKKAQGQQAKDVKGEMTGQINSRVNPEHNSESTEQEGIAPLPLQQAMTNSNQGVASYSAPTNLSIPRAQPSDALIQQSQSGANIKDPEVKPTLAKKLSIPVVQPSDALIQQSQRRTNTKEPEVKLTLSNQVSTTTNGPIVITQQNERTGATLFDSIAHDMKQSIAIKAGANGAEIAKWTNKQLSKSTPATERVRDNLKDPASSSLKTLHGVGDKVLQGHESQLSALKVALKVSDNELRKMPQQGLSKQSVAVKVAPINLLSTQPLTTVPVADVEHSPQPLNVPDLGERGLPQALKDTQSQDVMKRRDQYNEISRRLSEALGQRISAQVARGEWRVEMELHPRSLGRIEIQLEMKNGELEANFYTANSATKELISDSLPRLRLALEQYGMESAYKGLEQGNNGKSDGNSTAQQGRDDQLAKGEPQEVDAQKQAQRIADDGLDILI
jgi:flagellar hook-length control protein FliK